MADSNAEQQAQVAQPQTQTKQAAPTFLQRFTDLEQVVLNHQNQLQDANNAFSFVAKMLESSIKQTKEINEQLHAIYLLSETGGKISRETVAAKIQEIQVQSMKDMVDKEVQAGAILPLESVKDDKTIIVYSTPELAYAHRNVGGFEKEETRSALVGKKIGDVVENITIIGVYELAPQAAPTPAQSSETATPAAST